MNCDLLEGSTHLIPGFEHQLRLELVEQLELELPYLIIALYNVLYIVSVYIVSHLY